MKSPCGAVRFVAFLVFLLSCSARGPSAGTVHVLADHNAATGGARSWPSCAPRATTRPSSSRPSPRWTTPATSRTIVLSLLETTASAGHEGRRVRPPSSDLRPEGFSLRAVWPVHPVGRRLRSRGPALRRASSSRSSWPSPAGTACATPTRTPTWPCGAPSSTSPSTPAPRPTRTRESRRRSTCR